VANIIPELSAVQSEALQEKVRSLLPSQQGFGADLVAQNVIVPIIDLTAAAEGSDVGTNLQTAIAFGSQNVFSANNSTVVVANTAGFWRIFGTSHQTSSGSATIVRFQMSDGLSTKDVWQSTISGTGSAYNVGHNFDFIVFLASGESISAITSISSAFLQGSARQIADVNGVLTNPSGFSPQ